MIALIPVILGLLARRAGSSNDVSGHDYHAHAGVLEYVNPFIGTSGLSPNGNGGMIPSVSPPFGMTRWTPQTRENFISQCPYHYHDRHIHGFQATHQPAIWMGESGSVVMMPGIGDIQPLFENRGLAFHKEDERSTPYIYEVRMDAKYLLNRDWNATSEAAGYGPNPGGAGKVPDSVKEGANGRVRRWKEKKEEEEGEEEEDAGGEDHRSMREQANDNVSHDGCSIQVAMSASAHVGHLRFDFQDENDSTNLYVFVQASRKNWVGNVNIDVERREIFGSNPERQDYRLGPDPASSLRGYFVSRFSEPFASYGVTKGGEVFQGVSELTSNFSGAYVKFRPGTSRVEIRTGVSFVSIDQARKNLDIEIPDGTSFEETVDNVKSAWLEYLGRVEIEGVNKTDHEHDPRTIWYTALFHALQYPSDFSEPARDEKDAPRTFYSGYTDSVHTTNDAYYQSWSIWDTYRAEHSLLTIFAPERINSMMRSLLRIFDWSGWLPMWANVVETNIMVATNADAVLANALERGFNGFDVNKADTELLYYDREPNTPYEARAGLTSYIKQGWVSNDGWAESASRTLDYAFNDYACAVVARHAGAPKAEIEALLTRSMNYKYLWNNDTKFMQARNGNGTFADRSWGWTEGDDWVYTFNVMHDPLGLAKLFGGKEKMRDRLDAHFQDGHNEHSNEPSHHVPYFYSSLGYPSRTSEVVRELAWHNYNATSAGLSGNEDLGQMSAWYIFSSLGFYPVNPASDEYVLGAPFFEKVTIRLPPGVATGGRGGKERTLVISAPGAATKPYVKSLSIDGKRIRRPFLKHRDIVNAERIDWEMSDVPTDWGQHNDT